MSRYHPCMAMQFDITCSVSHRHGSSRACLLSYCQCRQRLGIVLGAFKIVSSCFHEGVAHTHPVFAVILYGRCLSAKLSPAYLHVAATKHIVCSC